MLRLKSPLALFAFLGVLAFGACASSAGAPSASVSLRSTHVAMHGPVALGDALADEAGVHLAVSLHLQNEEALDQLLRDQQDRTSPSYRAWLTPQDFGARFGLPEATYARIVAWLGAEGFTVTRYPNRLFLTGDGTGGGVRRLLGVQPRWASQAGRTFRSYAEELTLPADIAPLVE